MGDWLNIVMSLNECAFVAFMSLCKRLIRKLKLTRFWNDSKDSSTKMVAATSITSTITAITTITSAINFEDFENYFAFQKNHAES